MTGRAEHMSWCIGKHDDGDCVVKTVLPFGDRRDGYQSVMVLNGVPCDHLRIDSEPAHVVLCGVDDLDAYLQHLTDVAAQLDALRARFVASQNEEDCDGHDHSDDD
jgi:hypothetical protein